MRVCFLLFSFILIGCDNPFLRLPPAGVVSVNNPPPPSLNNRPGNTAVSSGQKWGVVRCHENDISATAFNRHVRGFLSTTINPQNFRQWIRCRKSRTDLKGGVWIRGSVYFNNGGKFQMNSFSQQLDVSENSFLEVHIVDTNNKSIAKISMQAIIYSSTVSGNDITLTFSDSKGKILLDGTVTDGIFSGPFAYENFTKWEGGSRGEKGVMGFFRIPVCSLLDCSISPAPLFPQAQ